MSEPRRVRVVSGGTSVDTMVYVDDVMLDNVRAVTWSIDGDGLGVAVLTLDMVEIDAVGEQAKSEPVERATSLRLAADLLDQEVAAEEARLTTSEHPHPWMVPMLGNWLGGISTAAQVLRDAAERAEFEVTP